MLSLEFLPSYSLSTLFLHATLTTREQEILLSSLLYLSFSSSTTKLKESVGTGLMTTSVCQSRSAFKIDGRFYAGKTINLQICKYKYRYFCNFVYLVLFDTPPHLHCTGTTLDPELKVYKSASYYMALANL